MTTAIIITICILLLIAYAFELTSSKTKIPPVILLLLLGWLLQQLFIVVKVSIPELGSLLPILGTIGLILIVLEGSLELEFNRSKLPLIGKSFAMALLPAMGLSFLLAYLFSYYGGYSFKDSLLNAIPFSIISSSLAIPSVREQAKQNREFVVYESSLSDIIGILFFNFMAYNATITAVSFGNFGLELVIMAAITFIATVGLSFLLSKIDHHIKFAPIIILVILVYEIAKLYQLPSLLFILLFGLFLGNLDELKRFRWIHKLKPDELNIEVNKFRELIVEATFLVKTIFFLLFGYLMQTSEIINTETLKWALVIVAAILITRGLLLWLFRLPVFPLLYIAPRGLINILLFLSIPAARAIGLVNKSLIVQVVVISALIMMMGLIFTKRPEVLPTEDNPEETQADYLI